MNDPATLISQVGFPIAVTMLLLWDYSKKLALIQLEQAKVTSNTDQILKNQATILTKLDALEKQTYERHSGITQQHS